MKVMSLNGWGGALGEGLLAYLAAADPDVLCLQEVVSTPSSTKDVLTYRDGDHVLPQRANLFRDVCAVLPDHFAQFCPAAQGVLFDGAVAVPSQWGLATFVRRAFPVIGQEQGFVHKGFSPDGYGDHPRSRVAHIVRLWDFAQHRAVTIGQMHGLRDLAGKHDTPDRLAQAERLAALFSQIAEPGDAQVLCGDFNVEPASETFAILGRLGLDDLVTARGFRGTRSSLYTKPGRFADYMLVNAALAAAQFDVVRFPEVSDHCPLVLEG